MDRHVPFKPASLRKCSCLTTRRTTIQFVWPRPMRDPQRQLAVQIIWSWYVVFASFPMTVGGGMCPPFYPYCDLDRDCTISACIPQCSAWFMATTVNTPPSATANYINGYDALGSHCTTDYVSSGSGASQSCIGSSCTNWAYPTTLSQTGVASGVDMPLADCRTSCDAQPLCKAISYAPGNTQSACYLCMDSMGPLLWRSAVAYQSYVKSNTNSSCGVDPPGVTTNTTTSNTSTTTTSNTSATTTRSSTNTSKTSTTMQEATRCAVLTTDLNHNNGQIGIYFQIVLESALTITAFRYIVSNTGTSQVWTRPGTYGSAVGSGWVLAATATVQQAGNHIVMLALQLSAGSHMILLSSSANVRYKNGASVGTVDASNADLGIYSGYGTQDLTPGAPGANNGYRYSPRNFAGTIEYCAANSSQTITTTMTNTMTNTTTTLNVTSTGKASSWPSQHLNLQPTTTTTTTTMTNTTTTLNVTSTGKAFACSRPSSWCVHVGASYSEVDCDGDHVPDPYCQDTNGDTGYIGSANGCQDTWPSGQCQMNLQTTLNTTTTTSTTTTNTTVLSITSSMQASYICYTAQCGCPPFQQSWCTESNSKVGGAFCLQNQQNCEANCNGKWCQAPTTLSLLANAGDTILFVASISGFQVGQRIIIDVGTNIEETNVIAGFGSMILQYPLQYSHSVGATVSIIQATTTNTTTVHNVTSFTLKTTTTFAALRGTASSSSVYGSTMPSNGIDGNVLTMAHTQGGQGEAHPWWQVDFGNCYRITTIIFLNRPDYCASRLFEFHGCMWSYSSASYSSSSQGALFRVGGTSCSGDVCPGQLCQKLTVPHPDHYYTISCNGLVGRYVSIQLPGNNRMLNFMEIWVGGVAEEDCQSEVSSSTNVTNGISTNATFSNSSNTTTAIAIVSETKPANLDDVTNSSLLNESSNASGTTLNCDDAPAPMTDHPFATCGSRWWGLVASGCTAAQAKCKVKHDEPVTCACLECLSTTTTTTQAWQCHHYSIGQNDAWCQQNNGQVIGRYEYKWSGPTGNVCGGCWCCKKLQSTNTTYAITSTTSNTTKATSTAATSTRVHSSTFTTSAQNLISNVDNATNTTEVSNTSLSTSHAFTTLSTSQSIFSATTTADDSKFAWPSIKTIVGTLVGINMHVVFFGSLFLTARRQRLVEADEAKHAELRAQQDEDLKEHRAGSSKITLDSDVPRKSPLSSRAAWA